MRFLLVFTVAAAAAAQPYTVALLRTPANPPEMPKERAVELQKAHMGHIQHMAKIGELIGAGPGNAPGSDLRGIFIFRSSLDRARELTDVDPWIKAGSLIMELVTWDGPDGVGEKYKAEHDKDPAAPTRMLKYQLALVRKGPNWTPGAIPVEIPRVRSQGAVTSAGTLAAILVLDAGSREDAEKILENLEAAKSGKVTFQVHNWMVADGVLP